MVDSRKEVRNGVSEGARKGERGGGREEMKGRT